MKELRFTETLDASNEVDHYKEDRQQKAIPHRACSGKPNEFEAALIASMSVDDVRYNILPKIPMPDRKIVSYILVGWTIKECAKEFGIKKNLIKDMLACSAVIISKQWPNDKDAQFIAEKLRQAQ